MSDEAIKGMEGGMPRWALIKGVALTTLAFSSTAALALTLLAFMGSRAISDIDKLTHSVNALLVTVTEINGSVSTRLAETNGRIASADIRINDLAVRLGDTTLRVGRMEDRQLNPANMAR